MTGDEFNARYQLLKRVSGGAATTYHALIREGAVVMVHFLEGAEHLLDRLDGLAPEASGRVLEVLEVDGAPVLVTRFILEFESLESWMDAHGGPPGYAGGERREAPGAPAASPPPPGRGGGPEDGAAPAPEPSAPEPSAPEPTAPGPSRPLEEPGEFTRLFGAADVDPRGARSSRGATEQPRGSPAHPDSPPDPAGEAPTEGGGGGAPGEGGQTPGEAGAPRPDAAGEFTRLFRTPLGEAEEPASGESGGPAAGDARMPDGPGGDARTARGSAGEAPAAEGPEAGGPGEFTRLFRAAGESPSSEGREDTGPEARASGAPSAGPAEPATGSEAAEVRRDRSDAPGAPAAEDAASVDESGKVPGEFTRLFRAAGPGARPATGRREGEDPPPEGKPPGPDREARRRDERVSGPEGEAPGREGKGPGPKGEPRPHRQRPSGRGAADADAPSPPVPPTPRERPSGTGDFTRMFGGPVTPAAGGSDEAGARGADGPSAGDPRLPDYGSEASGKGRREPGPYTRMFGRAELPEEGGGTDPEPERTGGSAEGLAYGEGGSEGYLERLAGAPREKRAEGDPPPSTPEEGRRVGTNSFEHLVMGKPRSGAGPAPAPPSGPSEFTRIVSAVRREDPAPARPAPAPAPPPSDAPARSPWPWILGLGAVVLLAGALVAVLVLWDGPAAAESPDGGPAVEAPAEEGGEAPVPDGPPSP